MRSAIAVAVAVGLLAAAGCGQSDEDQVKATAHDFFDALQDQDGGRACKLVTPDFAKQVTSSMNEISDTKGGCADALAGFQGTAVPKFPKVTAVNLNGNTATAIVEGDGGTRAQISLEKSGGDWKVSEF